MNQLDFEINFSVEFFENNQIGLQLNQKLTEKIKQRSVAAKVRHVKESQLSLSPNIKYTSEGCIYTRYYIRLLFKVQYLAGQLLAGLLLVFWTKV